MLSINLTYQSDAAMKTEIPHDTQKGSAWWKLE